MNLAAALAALGAIALIGCGGSADSGRAGVLSAPADLRATIASLVVAMPSDGAGYARSRFGGFVDADRNGCDTPCEVLARQRRNDLPGLPNGGWWSAYDAYSTDDSTELEVDHVVALKEAWVSGADGWDDATRGAFYNDLASPELLAVTAPVNRSKGDRDPAVWQPPNRDAWCDYVRSWVAVKVKWRLSADEAEVRALSNMAAVTRCE